MSSYEVWAEKEEVFVTKWPEKRRNVAGGRSGEMVSGKVRDTGQ
jgi:hypothetical protein